MNGNNDRRGMFDPIPLDSRAPITAGELLKLCEERDRLRERVDNLEARLRFIGREVSVAACKECDGSGTIKRSYGLILCDDCKES